MIDPHLEEQATLHVLGALTEAEAREFKNKLRNDPELQRFVASLSTATGVVAGAVPAVEPPPQLRAKILAQVESPQKIVMLPERTVVIGWHNPFAWIARVLAVCVVILCVLLFSKNSQLQGTIGEQAQKIDSLNALAQSLEVATNNLNQTVLALQETNRLDNVRIAMLDSLVPDAPKAVAVSLWDNQKQNGVFVAENLKALPSDRDYELWVIGDDKKPVASGVFHVDETGNIRIDFKPSQFVKAAAVFAVTEEVKGGVSSPTLKNLVLASK
jgi:anti-sigma-K factor RskA